APFTTSTLQQEASRKIGLSVAQTMRVAQKLYEEGHITYMRTDSLNLSKEAVGAMIGTITEEWGKEYLQPRHYNTKTKGAQEAHEAIRPTYVAHRQIDGTPQEKKLYELIWKRAVASQMADAQIERTIIEIENNKNEYTFVAKGEVVTFEGFLKAYNNKGDDVFLPPLVSGDQMQADIIEATERFEQRPARYSEAALVKHLEELGIGRPSTYAPTISTIIARGYVIKEDRDGVERHYKVLTLGRNGITQTEKSEIFGTEKSKLFPTDIGMIVTDYLMKNFASIMDYNFTAKVEGEFDDIAEGDLEWQKMLTAFYGGFHHVVENALSQEGGYATAEQRLLGVDPVSGKNDTEVKPKYAGLKPGLLIETVTLEEALALFALPRTLGEYEGKEMIVGEGRFGPYIRHNSVFISIPKSYEPLSITAEEAIELIELKRKKDSEKVMR
ncbi:MAG: DNA topoisomerase, partial [Rikenellaceae bacterium]